MAQKGEALTCQVIFSIGRGEDDVIAGQECTFECSEEMMPQLEQEIGPIARKLFMLAVKETQTIIG